MANESKSLESVVNGFKGKVDDNVIADAVDKFSMASAPDGTDLIYLNQLGNDKETAAKTIADAGITDKTLTNDLLDAWTAERTAAGMPTEPPTATPTPVTVAPNTPPPSGKVAPESSGWPNLIITKPDLEQIQFTVPDVLSSKPKKPAIHPSDCTWSDWLHVTKNCNLTKAFAVTNSGGVNALPAIGLPNKVALQWSTDLGEGFMDVVDDPQNAGVTIWVCFTAEDNLACQSLDAGVSANLSYWFMTATGDANWKSKYASKTSKRQIYMGWKQVIPICRLHLEQALSISEEFASCIRAAVAGISTKDDLTEQEVPLVMPAFLKLLALCQDYGHVVPTGVVLGGYFLYTNQRSIGTWDVAKESDLTADLKVNFAAAAQNQFNSNVPATGGGTSNPTTPTSTGDPTKPNVGAGGGIGINFDDQDQNWASSEALEQRIVSVPEGGDKRVTDPKDWAGTLCGPADWVVITRDGFESVFNYLGANLKTKVKKVWTAGRQIAWGVTPGTGKTLPDRDDILGCYPTPLFWTPNGISPVFILNRTTTDTDHPPLLQAASGVNEADQHPTHGPQIIDRQVEPHIFWEDFPPVEEQQFDIKPLELPGINSDPNSYRTEGTYFTHLDPAPQRLPQQDATNPAAAKALWKVVYSGDVNVNGEPLYWICSWTGDTVGDSGDSLLLAVFKDKGNNNLLWANLLPNNGVWQAKFSINDHPALWLIYPADPTGLRGTDFLSTYLICSALDVGGFLGPEIDVNGRPGWFEDAHEEKHIEDTSDNVSTSTGMFHVPHYEVVTSEIQRQTLEDAAVVVKRTSVKHFSNGLEDLMALSDAEFLKYCWRMESPQNQ